jgi:hypothetical protein
VQKGAGAYTPSRLLQQADGGGIGQPRLRVELSRRANVDKKLAFPVHWSTSRAGSPTTSFPTTQTQHTSPKKQKHNNHKNSVFDFAPSLAELLSAASLVISHAGSGSVFEALGACVPLIVVPNPILMDNHQAELAEHLERQGVARCAEPNAASLAKAVRALGRGGGGALAAYEPGDARGIARRIDQLMGRR